MRSLSPLTRPGRSLWRLSALASLIFVSLASSGVAQIAAPPYEPDATVDREQVPDAYKWKLDQLFVDDAAWEAAMSGFERDIATLAAFEGTLSDPRALERCLTHYFDLHDRVNHATLYANLKGTTNLSSDEFGAMQTRSLGVMDELMKSATFMRSEILAVPEDVLQTAYERQLDLRSYRSYIDNLRRRRDRVLGEEAERILGLAGDNLWAEIDLNEIPSPHEDTFGALLTNVSWPIIHDEEGNEVQMTLANYGKYRGSEDRAVRAEAVTAFFATLRQFQHSFAATLAGQYEFDVFLARARNYDTALEAYLDKDNLQPSVYENLIATVNANVEPLHRYVELRKKAMGLDELHLYDLYVPFVKGVDRDIKFDEARATLMEALTPLGKGYMDVLELGMDPASGWIDVYPSNDKRSGAFSASVYGRHPYVMMNYQDSLDDMSTVAHEYGHAVHSYLAMKHQPYSAFRYVPFLAEIASTANEAILDDYLIANAKSPEEKAYLLASRLEGIRTTIYRQTLFAEFERAVHRFVEEGTPVTGTLLDQTYGDLIRHYYGPGYTLDEDDGMEWAYIPHFYYKYYVFTYATGLSSGIAIANELRGDNAKAAQEGLLAMLSGGCSKAPLELLKEAGVDLTRPDAIEAALRLFDETVTELEKLVGQI